MLKLLIVVIELDPKEHATMYKGSQPGVFFQFCGGHVHYQQEDLTKFVYRAERKVQMFWHPTIFWRHARIFSLYLVISEKRLQILLSLAFQKKSIVWLAAPFFPSPNGKNCHKKKTLFSTRAKGTFIGWQTKNVNEIIGSRSLEISVKKFWPV